MEGPLWLVPGIRPDRWVTVGCAEIHRGNHEYRYWHWLEHSGSHRAWNDPTGILSNKAL
jgi:hypothetical protein